MLHLWAPKTFLQMHRSVLGISGKLFKCCTNNSGGISSYKKITFALPMKCLCERKYWGRWEESSCSAINECLLNWKSKRREAKITNQTLKLSFFHHNWNLEISLRKCNSPLVDFYNVRRKLGKNPPKTSCTCFCMLDIFSTRSQFEYQL